MKGIIFYICLLVQTAAAQNNNENSLIISEGLTSGVLISSADKALYLHTNITSWCKIGVLGNLEDSYKTILSSGILTPGLGGRMHLIVPFLTSPRYEIPKEYMSGDTLDFYNNYIYHDNNISLSDSQQWAQKLVDSVDAYRYKYPMTSFERSVFGFMTAEAATHKSSVIQYLDKYTIQQTEFRFTDYMVSVGLNYWNSRLFRNGMITALSVGIKRFSNLASLGTVIYHDEISVTNGGHEQKISKEITAYDSDSIKLYSCYAMRLEVSGAIGSNLGVSVLLACNAIYNPETETVIGIGMGFQGLRDNKLTDIDWSVRLLLFLDPANKEKSAFNDHAKVDFVFKKRL